MVAPTFPALFWGTPRNALGNLAPRMTPLKHHALQDAILFKRPVSLDKARLQDLVPSLETLGVIAPRHTGGNRLFIVLHMALLGKDSM
eukprot:13341700-Ditylum_brightwellii.AAC.2